jgi:hypothetical protein
MGKLNALMLFFPLLGISLVATEFVFFPHWRDVVLSREADFYFNLLLTHLFHIGLSYTLIVSTKPGRSFVQHFINNQTRKYWAFGIGLMFLIFTTLIIGEEVLELPVASNLSRWLWISFPLFHAIRQSQGISLMNNHQLIIKGGECSHKLRQYDSRERKIHKHFIIFWLITIVLMEIPFELPFKSWFHWGASAFFFGQIFRLQFLAWNELDEIKWQKIIFNIRYTLVVFIPYSAVAPWAFTFTHDLEYFMVFRKFTGGESKKNRFFIWSWLLFFSLLLLAIGIVSVVAGGNSNHALYPFYVVLQAFLFTISILHYLMDGKMFKFQKPTGNTLIIDRMFKAS